LFSGCKNMKETQYMFSEKLMAKGKRILEERSGLKLSMDEVEIHLERLSRFGLLFAKVMIQNEKKEKKSADQRD